MAARPPGLLARLRRWAQATFPPALTAREIWGAAAALLVIALLALTKAMAPAFVADTNYGFGPEWDCQNPGRGGGVNCIKRVASPSPPN